MGIQPPRDASKASEAALPGTAEPTRGSWFLDQRWRLTNSHEANAKQRAESRALRTNDPAVKSAHSLRIGTTQDTDRRRVLIEQALYDAKVINDPNFNTQQPKRVTRTPKSEQLLKKLILRNQLDMSTESLCDALVRIPSVGIQKPTA
jgi:hypothetical protein